MKNLIKKLLKEALGDKITYQVEHLDSYGGQSNYELGMYINGNIVGLVQYVLFEGKLTVSNIIVLPEMRRKGVGSRMMQYLKQYHPEYTYKPSMQTQDGAAFKHKPIDDLNSIDEDILNEVGELKNPYLTNGEFKFNNVYYGYVTTFKDEFDNLVELTFVRIQNSENLTNAFEVVFTLGNEEKEIRDTSIQAFKSTYNHYMRIISTVSEAFSQFLSQYKPNIVKMGGDDKIGMFGQKFKIYSRIVQKNKSKIKALGYDFKTVGNNIILTKQPKPIEENAVSNKKQYLGQCDLLRRKCDDNEAYWHDMMKNKKKISFNTFIKNVDMTAMLEDDETPKIWIKEALMSDSETASYVSNWGDKECMFIQTAGFEFIFI